MTCKDCKFYEKECDVHFHQELMGRKRVLKICEIFYPKEPRFIEANILVNDLLEAEANGGMGTVVARTLIRYVKRSKTVDAVEVVHGRWNQDGVYDVCSVCNRCTLMPHLKGLSKFNYCPNCGADMRERKDND